ncbi:MAG TPA: hypothetical protein VEP46_07445, partial [Vicinamibacterales bacterium]|nr:hypothetical protein [Vicinamibacterales bacterium]
SPHFASRSAQIAAVYRTVRLLKLQAFAAAATSYDRPDRSRCVGYTLCALGGAVPAGTSGLELLAGRWVGVAGELELGQQTWNTRQRPLYGEEIALRQSRGSALLRVNPPSRGLLSYAVLGGASVTVGDARGMTHVEGALIPTGGRHAVHFADKRLGYTMGVDLMVGGRFGLVVPIRMTYTPSIPAYWPSHLNLRAAVGVNARLFRHVG